MWFGVNTTKIETAKYDAEAAFGVFDNAVARYARNPSKGTVGHLRAAETNYRETLRKLERYAGIDGVGPTLDRLGERESGLRPVIEAADKVLAGIALGEITAAFAGDAKRYPMTP